MIEVRLGLDSNYTQRMSFALLSQSAFVSVIVSPFIGHFADKSSTKRVWLLSALVVCLVGTFALAVATSGEFSKEVEYRNTVANNASNRHLLWSLSSGAG